MKKLFILITLLLGFHTAWGHDAEVDGIFYNLNTEDKTANVTFQGDSYDSYKNEYSGDVVIPENVTVDGTVYAVTSLGDNCFSWCSDLTSITIPNTVTSLGAFCFYDCSGLTTVAIPNSVTSLGNFCFYGCNGLTSITIPETVASVGLSCFAGCNGLESIVVAAENPVYDSRDNCNAIIETSTNQMIAGCKNSQIPNTVTSLGAFCFYDCSGLTTVAIPNTVTNLGDFCFYGCSGLTSIAIPETVESVGLTCFAGCSGLESIVVAAENPVYDSRENCNAIIETSTNKMIAGCKNSQIPNTVTSLGNFCFYGCSGLTTVAIPESVTSLGNFCFEGCNGLTSIAIPNTVTILGEYCFSHCSGLTSITIPEFVTSLGDGCFSHCSSLTSIAIPEAVTSLGSNCFYNCSGLTSITIPESVTSLGDDCFNYCSGLTSIVIPDSVKSLGDGCFKSCKAMNSITMLPPTPPTVGSSIFDDTPLMTVYVADEEAKTLYEAETPWNEYEIVPLNTGMENIPETTGIENMETGNNATSVTGCYDLNGRRVSGKQSGPVIVRYSDGSTRKVVVK